MRKSALRDWLFALGGVALLTGLVLADDLRARAVLAAAFVALGWAWR